MDVERGELVVEVDVASGSAVSIGVTFRDPHDLPTPGAGGVWTRPVLDLQVAEEGTLQPLAVSGLLRARGRTVSPAERVGWVTAWLVTVIGLLVVRPLDDRAGTLVATVGALVLVVMSFRRMLFRACSDRDDG